LTILLAGQDPVPGLAQPLSHYLPLIKEILEASNLPEDLAYVAMIESGFRSMPSRGRMQQASGSLFLKPPEHTIFG